MTYFIQVSTVGIKKVASVIKKNMLKFMLKTRLISRILCLHSILKFVHNNYNFNYTRD
jgi:hypothetical protein